MKLLVAINDWLVTIGEFGLAIAVLFGLIALLAKRTRGAFGSYLYFLSFIIGAATWILSAITLYRIWGFIGFFIGLFIAGVGVVPVSMLAMAIHGEWMLFSAVVVQLVLLFGCRFVAIAILENNAKREQREADAAFALDYEIPEED
jgi:hypothetical protein